MANAMLALHAAGLTQERIAAIFNLNHSTVNYALTKRRKTTYPGAETAISIAVLSHALETAKRRKQEDELFVSECLRMASTTAACSNP